MLDNFLGGHVESFSDDDVVIFIHEPNRQPRSNRRYQRQSLPGMIGGALRLNASTERPLRLWIQLVNATPLG